jgi:hypothetical protein
MKELIVTFHNFAKTPKTYEVGSSKLLASYPWSQKQAISSFSGPDESKSVLYSPICLRSVLICVLFFLFFNDSVKFQVLVMY